MVGECLVVVDTAATAQDTLRSFHNTGRAATVASTTAAAAGAPLLCNNYLLLLPKELLDQVRQWPSLLLSAPAWRSASAGTAVAVAETEGNAGDALVAMSDSKAPRTLSA